MTKRYEEKLESQNEQLKETLGEAQSELEKHKGNTVFLKNLITKMCSYKANKIIVTDGSDDRLLTDILSVCFDNAYNLFTEAEWKKLLREHGK